MSTAPSLASLLGTLVQNQGSDLHIQSDEVPMGRIHGQLGRFEMPPLSQEDVLRLAREVLGSDEKLEGIPGHAGLRCRGGHPGAGPVPGQPLLPA